MQPFTRVFRSKVVALGAHHDELAVLTDDGVELSSLSLEPHGRIRGGAPRTSTLARLADGRWIAFKDGLTPIYAGREGGALAPIWPGEGYAGAPIVTATGFVANHDGRLWIDEGGEGRWVHHGVPGAVLGREGDRLLLAGMDGLGVIDVKGARIAHAEIPHFVKALAKVCAVAPGRFAMQYRGALEVRSADDLALLATLPNVLVHETAELDGDLVISGDGRVSRWSWLTGERVWERGLAGSVQAAHGGHVLLLARDPDRCVVLDRHGDRVDELAVDLPLWRVAPFGAGFALKTARRASWWRAPGDVVELPHDVGAERFEAFDGGLFTTEGRALHAWRPEAQGMAVPAVSTAMPMGETLVVGGTLLRTVRVGRFRVVAEAHGHEFAVDAHAPFRAVVSKADAAAIVERLVAREPMRSAIPEPVDEDELAQRPPAEAAALHAAALFDPGSLTPRLLYVVERARERFFGELAHALDVSPHTLLGAVRAGRFPLTAPRALVSAYEYLGSFETDGALWVADPSCFARRDEERGPLTSVELAAPKGRFHAFLRRGSAGDMAHRTGELVVVHEDGFEASATSRAGALGVGTGLAGIFDAACPAVDLDRQVDEGVVHDRGVLSRSGWGDGGYPVYVARVARKVVKIRIAFEDEAEPDRAVLAPPPGGRKYAPSARFAVGESLEHAKFGAGVVESLTPDGKIVVRFADGARTLVHAR